MSQDIENVLLQASVDSIVNKNKVIISKLASGNFDIEIMDTSHTIPLLNRATEMLIDSGAPVLTKKTEIITDKINDPELLEELIQRSGINSNNLDVIKKDENQFLIQYSQEYEDKIRYYILGVLQTKFKPKNNDQPCIKVPYYEDKNIDVSEIVKTREMMIDLYSNKAVEKESEHDLSHAI